MFCRWELMSCVGRGNVLYAEFTRLSDYDFSAPDVFVEIFDVDRVRPIRLLGVARLGLLDLSLDPLLLPF